MSSATSHPIGVDFGGSGVKAAPVDLAAGEFAAERVRIPTPVPATPAAVTDVIAELVARLDPEGGTSAVGVTVPGVVVHGVVHTAANIDQSWVGADANALLTDRLGRPVSVLNDADAAGLAEVRFGAARNERGLVVLTTLGTGIGSALVHDGRLIPNSELGHLEIDGEVAEKRAASRVRTDENLSWEQWAARLTRYYQVVERLLTPDLFVVGGGVSKNADQFLHLIDIRTPLRPATLRNTAGIVGAALAAAEEHPG